MKKAIMVVCALVLFGTLGSNCNQPGPGGATDGRGVLADGKPLLDALNLLEQEVARLEKQGEAMQRKPLLNKDQVITLDLAGAPSKGPENAKLTMVVFSDFQCPFCKKFADVSKTMLEKYPNDLRLVFMNFPLDNTCNPAMSRPMHPSACLAAEASLAAAEQGKFWEMHDFIFGNPAGIKEDALLAFAKTQGLNVDQMKQAIDSQKFKDQIQKQAAQLTSAGGSGTPTVYINGMLVQNPRWDDPGQSVQLIADQLNPKAPEEAKPALPVAVQNTKSLPTVKVVLDDGTRLDDRLADLQKRLAALNFQGPGQRPPKPKPSAPDPNKVNTFDLSKSPAQGPDGAPVTIVYFCDLLSPQCQIILTALKEIRGQNPDQVRLVYKNSPNPTRPNALETHETAMEALAQGKFWEMQDKILENRDKINPEVLRKLAQETGLKMDQYDASIKEHRNRQMIITDFREIRETSISGQSAVFVNGKYVTDPTKEGIAAAVTQAQKAPAPAPAVPRGPTATPQPPPGAPVPAPQPPPGGPTAAPPPPPGAPVPGPGPKPMPGPPPPAAPPHP